MAELYTIIFTLTFIIAILVLDGMSILMFLGKETNVWPPDTSECPDYWNANADGSCSPTSVGNKGSNSDLINGQIFDPTTCGGQGSSCTYADLLAWSKRKIGQYTAVSPRCRRQAWANGCGVYWDGISDISPMFCKGGSMAPPPSPSPSGCDCSKCSNLLGGGGSIHL